MYNRVCKVAYLGLQGRMHVSVLRVGSTSLLQEACTCMGVNPFSTAWIVIGIKLPDMVS